MTGLMLVEGEAVEGEVGSALAHKINSIADHAIMLNVSATDEHADDNRQVECRNAVREGGWVDDALATCCMRGVAGGPCEEAGLPGRGRDVPDERAEPRGRAVANTHEGLRAGQSGLPSVQGRACSSRGY